MTSPPYKYTCKHCKHNNWIMPHKENWIFECEKCNKQNEVRYFFGSSFWRVKKVEEETDERLPEYFCKGCPKYLGFSGFCSEKCHNDHYDGIFYMSEEGIKNG